MDRKAVNQGLKSPMKDNDQENSTCGTRTGQLIFNSDGMSYRGKGNSLKATMQNKDTYATQIHEAGKRRLLEKEILRNSQAVRGARS